jgi:hypothetical protein
MRDTDRFLADDDLAAIGLVDVDVQRRRDDDVMQPRFEPFRDQRLQRCVTIGSSTPAMRAMVEHQPAVALTTVFVRIVPRLVTTSTRPSRTSIAVTSVCGWIWTPSRSAARCVAPDDGVVADDAARRVIEPGEDRLMRTVAQVEAGHQVGTHG